MKKLAIAALAAAAFLPGTLPLQASEVVANGTEAKQNVTDDGYIIFAYAEGWDAYSKKRCETLMAGKALRKAAGNAVLMPMPVAETPDEATKKRLEEHRAGLAIPGSSTYPALFFLDKDGRHYATLSGSAVARGTDAALAELVADRLKKGHERRRLLAEADKQQGARRAELLFKAGQIDGLSWMGKEHNQAIRKADPKNESGVITSLDFDGYGLARKFNGMALKDAMAEAEKMLANKAYTARQKQLICTALLGSMRRKAGMAEADAMRRYVRLMRDFAPETPEGRAADKIMREWIPGFNIARGWSPACIPPDGTPVELEGKLPIGEAGTYVVRFRYTGGRMAAVIDAVELYDGKMKVAEDRHRGTTGNSHWKNEYTLKVGAAVKQPHLFVTFGKGDDRDTYGKVSIERQ